MYTHRLCTLLCTYSCTSECQVVCPAGLIKVPLTWPSSLVLTGWSIRPLPPLTPGPLWLRGQTRWIAGPAHTHSTLPPSLCCYLWAGHGAACTSRHVFSAWLISQGALVLQLLGGGSYFTRDMFRSYLRSQHDQNTVVYTDLCLALQGCVCACVRVCLCLCFSSAD